ncbi:MAG: MCE family protein [Proteobacteria bacterium]|nr:MCE family protein [Pseudomonadota bacterium]
MAGNLEQSAVPTASARRRRRIPLIWIVPALSLLIALWLAWDTYSKRGPTITISFESGAGLQAGQSQLKFKDVTMGTVKSIAVSPDFSKVILTVETTREAVPLLSDKTVFWIVKPQLFAGSVSGLDTILSGSYIGMLPSTEPGKSQTHFVGSEDPPILSSAIPGTIFALETKKLGAISLGSPIFYRGLEVGKVLGWDLSDMARHVSIHAFVRAPFDKYVHDDSLFWNASGISFKLGPDGVAIQMESARALLLGGISFDTRPDSKAKASDKGHRFPLYANLDAAQGAGYGRLLHMKSNFSGSVAGLSPGADVTLHGLKIGEVTDVGLVFDPKAERIVAPVHYRIEADRIAGVASMPGVPMGVGAAEMIRRGFRATLQSPSLLTGQKIVAIEMVPDAPPAELSLEDGILVVPSAEAGGFDSITRSANELLSKINRIDFAKIGVNLVGITSGLNDTINGPELKKSLADLEATMADVKDIARKLDAGATPAMARLPQISADLQDTLAKTSRLAGSVNSAYGTDSRFSRDLDRLMPQLVETARSLRALADLLARHPEALLQGRKGTGKE